MARQMGLGPSWPFPTTIGVHKGLREPQTHEIAIAIVELITKLTTHQKVVKAMLQVLVRIKIVQTFFPQTSSECASSASKPYQTRYALQSKEGWLPTVLWLAKGDKEGGQDKGKGQTLRTYQQSLHMAVIIFWAFLDCFSPNAASFDLQLPICWWFARIQSFNQGLVHLEVRFGSL